MEDFLQSHTRKLLFEGGREGGPDCPKEQKYRQIRPRAVHGLSKVSVGSPWAVEKGPRIGHGLLKDVPEQSKDQNCPTADPLDCGSKDSKGGQSMDCRKVSKATNDKSDNHQKSLQYPYPYTVQKII